VNKSIYSLRPIRKLYQRHSTLDRFESCTSFLFETFDRLEIAPYELPIQPLTDSNSLIRYSLKSLFSYIFYTNSYPATLGTTILILWDLSTRPQIKVYSYPYERDYRKGVSSHYKDLRK
jgi:hypothetical protein